MLAYFHLVADIWLSEIHISCKINIEKYTYVVDDMDFV